MIVELGTDKFAAFTKWRLIPGDIIYHKDKPYCVVGITFTAIEAENDMFILIPKAVCMEDYTSSFNAIESL